MKSQKEAERAEQQRIKNLVLNLNDSQENGDPDGTPDDFFLQPNPNLQNNLSQKINTHSDGEGFLSERHHHNTPFQQAPHHSSTRSSDKGAGVRGGQRTRKLQFSDVDWSAKSDFIKPEGSVRASPNVGRSKGRGRGHGRYGKTHG